MTGEPDSSYTFYTVLYIEMYKGEPCLSAAEVYSVKIIQQQKRSTQEDNVDKAHCLQSVVINSVTSKQQNNASFLWGLAECAAHNST